MPGVFKMTPTQAQIEAAAKAMQTTDNDDGKTRWHDWAKAALTAAAQVWESDIDWNAESLRLSSCLLKIHAAKTASADALRSVAYDAALNCITPDVAEFQCERRTVLEPLQPASLNPATIERCAQVAEGFDTGSRLGNGWGRLIAIAIRALKDNP
jgi:hypothetical protein